MEATSDANNWVILVDSSNVKKIREVLINARLLDESREISAQSDGRVSLPVLSDSLISELSHLGQPIQINSPKRRRLNPHIRLKDTISQHIAYLGDEIDAQILDEIPTRWQRLGDLVLLPSNCFSSESWQRLIDNSGSNFWNDIASALGATRLGIQAEIDSGPMRKSQVELLLGDDGWLEHKENGIIYGFDVTKAMFSSGNITERIRIANIDCKGEVVIDMYAGIGYYTLPLLIHSNAAHVHAMEMNPDSIDALHWNLKQNHVSERCTIYQGDNQHNAPALEGIADRVMLGLLPSSAAAWESAVRCLKHDGGTLHIHMNVVEEEIETWASDTYSKLLEMAKKNQRDWKIEAQNLERIKWYAPHVRHVVLDIKFQSH